MRYPVNEIFETIQGEANYTGTPAIFIRLQGCPVGCGWCDTKHTWYLDAQDKTIVGTIIIKKEDSSLYAYMDSECIYASIRDYSAKHVVITGGEPCLYDLNELCNYLDAKGYTTQIETSGTHEIRAPLSAWVTVSPKIDMAGGFKVLPETLLRADEIKHPVGKQKDVDNLLNLLADMPQYYSKTWLQPLSQSKSATALCVKTAIKHGFRVSLQTHKYLGVR